MGETDIAFRHLLQEVPEPILKLAFPRRRLRYAGPLDASADRPRQRTTDVMFRVLDGKTAGVLHVEVERGWRPKETPKRVFDYASAAHSKTGLPVISVVLLLKRGGKPPRSPAAYRVRALGADLLVLRYHIVPLYELDARAMKRRLPPEAWACSWR